MTKPGRSGQPGVNGWFPVSLLFFFLSAAIWYAFWQEMYLSADGAYYFAGILDSGRVFNYIPARLYANVASQWPLILAVKAGFTNLETLKFLFSFGLYFPYLVSIGLCAYARRGMDPYALMFPLTGYLLVSFPLAYLWVGESQVMAVATWPVLYFLLRPSPTRVDVALLISLLLFLSRTYEAAVGAAVVFTAIIMVRLMRGPAEHRRWLVSALGAVLVVLGVCAYSAIFPARPENRAGFVSGVLHPLSNPNLVCGLVGLFVLAAAILSRRVWLLAVSVAAGVVSVLMALLGHTVSAGVSFDSRSLALTLLPLLLLGATWFVHRSLQINRTQVATMIAVFLLLIAGNVVSWDDWVRYRVDFVRTLGQSTGYVAIEDTASYRSPIRWGWTSPLLSVLWSGDCVRAVILNSSNRWEPFDPRKSLPMQSYFRFAESFHAVAPRARACEQRP